MWRPRCRLRSYSSAFSMCGASRGRAMRRCGSAPPKIVWRGRSRRSTSNAASCGRGRWPSTSSTLPDAQGAFRLLRHQRQLSTFNRRRLPDTAALAEMAVAPLVEEPGHLGAVLAVGGGIFAARPPDRPSLYWTGAKLCYEEPHALVAHVRVCEG